MDRKLSVHQIVRELEKNGIKTYHEFDTWAPATISKMLRSTVYTGYLYYNKHKRKGRRQAKRDKSEWIKIECTPIIPPDVFEAAQEIIKHNKEQVRKRPKRFYLLSGMVVCSECKKPYFSQTITRQVNPYIQQGYRHRINQGHCSNRWITIKKLEPLVWERVVNILLNPAYLRKGYEQMMDEEREKQARQITHLETLEAGIEKIVQKWQDSKPFI